MRRSSLAVALAIVLAPASTVAESWVGELSVAMFDLELDMVATPTELAPGETSVVRVRLANNESFAVDTAVVEVRLPPGLVLVSATPARGTFAAGQWNVADVYGFEFVNLELTVQAEPSASGAATIVAEVMSAAASFDAQDPDSEPANGDPCEDDWDSVILQLSGDGDAGTVPDAGAGIDAGSVCPGPPDAGADPPRDADVHLPPPDAGSGDEGDGAGCGCSGGGAGSSAGFLLVILATIHSRRVRKSRIAMRK